MKKTTNIIGYLAAFAVAITAAFKFNHMEGAGMVMIITTLFLSIYFPVFILDKMRDSVEGKISPAHIVAALCASIINLGIVFKFIHWPGAGILLTVGLASFSLIFVPMLFIQKSKQAGANNIMNGAGAIGLAVFALGVLCKIQHWPGAAILLIASPALLFLIYFPMYMMNTAIPGEKKASYLRDAFFVIIIGCLFAMFVYSIAIEQNETKNTTTDTTMQDK